MLMKVPVAIESAYNTIPAEVKAFLKKALVIFIVWKLLYHLVLFPYRFPDKQLTEITAHSTAFTYRNIFDNPNVTFGTRYVNVYSSITLKIGGKKAIGIADGCNGLELFVLYVGFLACFTGNVKRMLMFLVVGLAVIFVLNILRCTFLAWLYLHKYSISDLAHHYIFKIIIYAVIFYIWILYLKKAPLTTI